MRKFPFDSIRTSASIIHALENNLPLVALESTVITHGLPYPENLAVLARLENLIKECGAVPATIIVWKGQASIGIDEELLNSITPVLASRTGGAFDKLGIRDLPLAFARNRSGGTTVSATVALAAAAGIEVFATGGIGGAHRGWQNTGDISSDLTALASYPVAVVSAGSKAILDVASTLEMLETLAVPVWGWKTEYFPLFYTSHSEYSIEAIQSTTEFVAAWRVHQAITNYGKGVLIANPIPLEQEIPAHIMEPYIKAGIDASISEGISGKAITPFLLDYLARHTEGDSVTANLALLENNALLAAKLAIALKG